MKNRLVLVGFAAALSLLGAVACGGEVSKSNDETSSGGSSAGGSAAAADFYILVAEVTCRMLFECCPEGEHPDIVGESVESCIAVRSGLSLPGTALLDESVAQRRANVDEARVASCTATFEAAACASPYPLECMGETALIQPLVPLGGACENDYECMEGFCTGSASGGEDGVCELPRELGAACEDDEQCASGDCHYSDGVCVTPRAAGDPCDVGPECASGSCDMTANECLPEPRALCTGFAMPR